MGKFTSREFRGDKGERMSIPEGEQELEEIEEEKLARSVLDDLYASMDDYFDLDKTLSILEKNNDFLLYNISEKEYEKVVYKIYSNISFSIDYNNLNQGTEDYYESSPYDMYGVHIYDVSRGLQDCYTVYKLTDIVPIFLADKFDIQSEAGRKNFFHQLHIRIFNNLEKDAENDEDFENKINEEIERINNLRLKSVGDVYVSLIGEEIKKSFSEDEIRDTQMDLLKRYISLRDEGGVLNIEKAKLLPDLFLLLKSTGIHPELDDVMEVDLNSYLSLMFEEAQKNKNNIFYLNRDLNKVGILFSLLNCRLDDKNYNYIQSHCVDMVRYQLTSSTQSISFEDLFDLYNGYIVPTQKSFNIEIRLPKDVLLQLYSSLISGLTEGPDEDIILGPSNITGLISSINSMSLIEFDKNLDLFTEEEKREIATKLFDLVLSSYPSFSEDIDFIKKLELAKSLTGEHNTWNKDMETVLYDKLLSEGEFYLVKELLSVTKIALGPDSQRIVNNYFNNLIKDSYISIRSIDVLKDKMELAKSLTGESVILDRDRVIVLYDKPLSEGEFDFVKKLLSVTKIALGPDSQRIINNYFNDLIKDPYISIDAWKDKIESVKSLTGESIILDKDKVIVLYDKFLSKGQFDFVKKLLPITNIALGPDSQRIINNYFNDLIKNHVSIGSWKDKMKLAESLTGESIIWDREAIVIEYNKFFLNTKNIFEIIDKLFTLVNFLGISDMDSVESKKLMKWIDAFKSLEKVQARSANKAHDPWLTDLRPLLERMRLDRLFEISQPEDVEQVIEFVKDFGMNNLPTIFSVYVELVNKNKFADLSERSILLLKELGIVLKKEKRDGVAEYRYPSPKSLINEIKKYVISFRQDLLSDRVPVGIESTLGSELFDFLKKNTEFKRGDSLKDILQLWKKTLEEYPDLGILPDSYQERTFEVDTREVQDTVDSRDADKKEAELIAFLSSKEVSEIYQNNADVLSKVFHDGSKTVLEEKISSIVSELHERIINTEQLLSMDELVLSDTVNNETDPEKKKSLEKIQKALSNPKGRIGFQKQLDSMRQALEQMEDPIGWWTNYQESEIVSLGVDLDWQKKILEVMGSNNQEQMDVLIAEESDNKKKNTLKQYKQSMLDEVKREKAIVRLQEEVSGIIRVIENKKSMLPSEVDSDEKKLADKLEGLVRLDKKIVNVSEISLLASAVHLHKVMLLGWHENIRDKFVSGTDPSLERLEFLATLFRQYISEHYLHEEQNPEHTEHTSFSKELMQELKSVWKIIENKKGELMHEQIARKAKQIIGSGLKKTEKKVATSMVPVRGLLRIFSGDIGNACYTSQHDRLARGECPGLKAWVFVTGKGENRESWRGTLLGVETTSDEGVPTLVARANNPKETFIENIDADAFVVESLREVVNTARRIWEQRRATVKDVSKKRQFVAIPWDRTSQSSTNREAVEKVYKKYFSKEPVFVGLKNEPETNFNGYNIWNKNGAHKCLIIWEIDKDGNEVWHGDWGSK